MPCGSRSRGRLESDNALNGGSYSVIPSAGQKGKAADECRQRANEDQNELSKAKNTARQRKVSTDRYECWVLGTFASSSGTEVCTKPVKLYKLQETFNTGRHALDSI